MPFALLKNRVWAKAASQTFVLALSLFSSALFAATIVVPIDQPTIQAGINAAQNGDTVLVNPNTYGGTGNRDIEFGGKAIVVRSRLGSSETKINCGGSSANPHIAFNFHQQETESSVVDGFQIWSAWGNPTNSSGAINCVNSSPTIRNCDINQSNCNGIFVTNNSHPRIIRCVMNQNSESGIAIGDVELMTSGGFISECLLWNNLFDGIRVYNCDSLQITNCTSVENDKYGFYLIGDMPKEAGFVTPITILEKSIAGRNAHGGINKQPGFHGLMLTCNDAFANSGNDFSGVDSFLTAGYGNFSADPHFCSPLHRNFDIHDDSPCSPDGNDCQVLIGGFAAGCDMVCGDADRNSIITISDAVFTVNYIFCGGPAPGFIGDADADCNMIITITDAVYIINYIFSGGPAPGAYCQ